MKAKRMKENGRTSSREATRNSVEKSFNEGVSNRRTSKKKSNKKWTKILLIVIVLIIALIVISKVCIDNQINKVNCVELNKDEIKVTDGIEQKLEGYRTIAIMGVDGTSDEMQPERGTDFIVLATINEQNRKVALTTIYRDTYLEITGQDLNKISNAYAEGKETLALSTLNENLDLNIKEFVTLNVGAMENIVDAIGGIEVNITDEELQSINGYINEVSRQTGETATYVEKSGSQKLNGMQALAYGRIKFVGSGNYKKAERMVTVLMTVIKQAKKSNVFQINGLADVLLPKLYTNVNRDEVFDLMKKISDYEILNNVGWPYKVKGATVDGVWYLAPTTLESAVKELHEKVYGQTNYEPSNKVKEISGKVIEKTGYAE